MGVGFVRVLFCPKEGSKMIMAFVATLMVLLGAALTALMAVAIFNVNAVSQVTLVAVEVEAFLGETALYVLLAIGAPALMPAPHHRLHLRPLLLLLRRRRRRRRRRRHRHLRRRRRRASEPPPPPCTGAILLSVGLATLVALCAKSRCLFITLLIFWVLLLLTMFGISAFLAYWIHSLDDVTNDQLATYARGGLQPTPHCRSPPNLLLTRPDPLLAQAAGQQQPARGQDRRRRAQGDRGLRLPHLPAMLPRYADPGLKTPDWQDPSCYAHVRPPKRLGQTPR
jgi:hypothetical protein